MADWYDYPQYFDMVFRDETDDEVRFFEAAFAKFAEGPVSRVFEPGCGSGRLVVAMAAKGYQMTGLDLSEPMLAYLRARLKRRKLSSTLICGDMTTIKLDETFDAAFCTFNTFRHLLCEDTAIAHLRSMADHVRPGGLYVLGFHMIPLDADTECTERWRASHGGTNVSVTLRVIDFDRRRRQEQLRVSIKATKRSGTIERIRSEFPLRIYTPAQAESMLAKVDDVWQISQSFDFDYDIDSPRSFDDDLCDGLFVLKRR